MALFIAPAVKQVGAAKRVQIVTFNADLPIMQMMTANNVVTMDLGNSLAYEGWAFADVALRPHDWSRFGSAHDRPNSPNLRPQECSVAPAHHSGDRGWLLVPPPGVANRLLEAVELTR